MTPSASKIARALAASGIALILAAWAASAGDPPGVHPPKGPSLDWGETRDPFEFEPDKPRTPEGPGPTRLVIPPVGSGLTEKPGPQETVGEEAPPPKTQEEMLLRVRAMAEDRALRAEEQLARHEYSAVVETTVGALNKIKEVQLPAPALVERLSRAHDTARRLKQRNAIEEEFRNLAISIGAVAWSPTNPVALINGELRRPGDTVLGARIEEIGRGEVIFSLKGVRMRRISGAVSGK